MRFSILAAICAASFAVRADYPLASHKYAADPTALEFNGRLYLYCSNDTDNPTNSYQMHSISCYSSDDLKNWTDHGEVLQVPHDVSWATLSWAPSAISNNRLVYLYFANGAGSIGVTTSSVPTGPFKDARGSALINSSTPGASSPTQWYFDPCAFIDTDGQPYLYFGGSAPTNSRVIRLGANLTSVSGSATGPFTTNFFEASHMHKRNGMYYLTYSTTPSAGMTIYCETNSNPTNGFIPQGTVLPNPPVNVFNNNHHSIVSFGGNWYIAYHNRFVAEANGLSDAVAVYKRSLCLDALSYNPDGSIIQVTPTTNGLAQLKYLDPYARTEAETIARQSGIFTEPCSDGGLNVTNIANGNWIMVRGVDFTSAGATSFTARIAGAGPGGNIELRLDGTNGTLVGTCAVSATGGWQTWASVSCAVSNATARNVHDLYLKFTGAGATNLFNFNWWQFQSATNSSVVSLVKFEAESGTLGTNFAVTNGTPTFITITNNLAASNPGDAARVASYTVTFPVAGAYELYARVRVGPGTFNDDSLFYGNGFGAKNPATNSDWILVNGLGSGGFSTAGDIVTGGGAVGSGVWKWINLSQFAAGPIFTVTNGGLTQTFQIGAREDGLDMDAFVFGLNGVLYTVAELDAGAGGILPDGDATLDWNDPRQQMDGFGAGVVFLDGGVSLTDARADTLFKSDTTNQLALTLLRVRIEPNSNWSNSVSGWSGSVNDAKRAALRGAGVLATPWTPPAAMKTSTNTVGGSLLTNQYANYAAYLEKYASNMLANGVSLRAVSVQNEPDWDPNYEGCVWSGAQFLNFFRTNAGVIQSAPVMMPESLGFNFNYSDPSLNDAVAVTNIDFIGGHLYGVNTITPYTNALAKGKHLWMTEYLENDQSIERAIQTLKQIHECLTTGSMSAYIWWKCLDDDNGLLNGAGVIQKRGYMVSQFSRFVRPGHYRIGGTNLGNSFVSAFKDTTNNQFAIIAINPYSLAFDQTISLTNFPPSVTLTPWITSGTQSLATLASFAVTNGTFTYNLPPTSIITFVSTVNSNAAPVFAAVGPQTLNPGVTVLITNAVTDVDLPGQILTFTLLTAPTNAALSSLNASNALFNWRPLISQAASTNAIQVKVTDSGTPSLSATNSFVLTVNLASQPALSSIILGSQVSFSATGMIGPDYLLFTSTNLSNWQLLFTTNPTAMPVTLTDTNRGDAMRLYRLQLGP